MNGHCGGTFRIVVATLALIGGVLSAAAQEAEQEPAGQETAPARSRGLQLEEVLVTAGKREELFREVPSSVQVMTGDDLAKVGATDFLSMLDYMPSVNTSSRGKGASMVVVRGVSSGPVSNPTGVYVDETPVGSTTAHAAGSAAVDFIALDMKRVELLAGPQGTLYGSGALGGILKYVTNEPDPNAWEAMLEYGESSIERGGDSRLYQGMANIPLSADVAAFRLAYMQEDFGGYIDNPRQGIVDQDETESRAYRASLLFNLPSDISLKLMYSKQELDRKGNPTSDRDGASGEPTGGELEETTYLAEPWLDDFYVGGLEVNWDFGDVSLFGMDVGNIALMSSTTQQQREQFFSFDVTRIFGALLGTGEAVLWAAPDWIDVERFTQELRLTSNNVGPFNWQLGLFYAKEDSSQYIFVADVGVTALDPLAEILGGSGIPDLSELTTAGLTGVLLFDGLLESEMEEWAVFPNITYSFTDRFDITVGYRWATLEQDYFQSFGGFLGNPRNPAERIDDTGHSKFKVTNYLINPRYFITDDIMVYFRAADGFRPGGPNFIIRDPATNEPRQGNKTFEPDELENFELGTKAAFFGNRLTFDAAVFTIRWDNIQLFVTRDGTNNLENGGKARIDGAEIASRIQPLSWLAITGSAAFLETSLEEDVPSLGASEGSPLELTPEFASSVLVDTFFDLTDWLSLTVGLSYTYSGERNQGFEGSAAKPLYKMDAYETYGARMTLSMPYVDLTLFAKNITDERGELGANTADYAADSSLPVRATIMQPRTVGASIRITY